MSLPLTILAAGAALGAGAGSAPFIGGALSKTITGEVVPTRIVDLAGYLTASGAGAKGLDQSGGFEDFENEISVGTPDGSPIRRVPSNPTPATPPTATADSKRMLAVASFGGALLVTGLTFVLIRRLLP